MKPTLSITHLSDFVNQPPLTSKPTSQMVNWTRYRGDDFIQYEVVRGTTSDVTKETGTVIETITDQGKLSYLDTGLNPDTNYYYKVYVKKDSGDYTGWEDISSNAPVEPVIDAYYDSERDSIISYHGSETWEYEGEGVTEIPMSEVSLGTTLGINNGNWFSGRVITSDNTYIYIALNQLYIYDKNLNLIDSFGSSGSEGYQSVSVDDDYIYLGDSDNTVEIYNKSDFSLEETLEDATDYVRSVYADTDYIYVGGSDNNTYIYNKSDFILETTLSEATYYVTSVYADTDYIYAGSYDNNTYIYNKSDFSLNTTLTDATGNVLSVYADTDYVYVGSTDNNTYIYNKSDFTLNTTLTDATNNVYSVYADTDYIYNSSIDGNTRIYNKSDFTLEKTLSDHGTSSGLSVYSDRDYIIITSRGDDTYIYPLTETTQLWNRLEDGSGNPIDYPTDGTNALNSSFDNALLPLGTYDGSTPVQETWKLDPSTPAWTQLSPTTQPPARTGHGFAGEILFGGEDVNGNYLNDTWRWDEANQNWVSVTTSTSPSARKDFAMVEGEDGNVYLYGGEASDGSLLNDFWKFDGSDWSEVSVSEGIPAVSEFSLDTTLEDAGDTVRSVYADTDYVYVGGSDNNTYIYNKSDFSLETTLTDATDYVLSVYADTDYIYVGSWDNNTYIYNKSDFTLNTTLTDATDNVLSVYADTDYIYVGSTDNNTYIYNKSDFTLNTTLTDATGQVYSVYADTDYIYSSSVDGNTRIYNKSDFTLEKTLSDHGTSSGLSVYSDRDYIIITSRGDDTYVYNKSDFTLNTTLGINNGNWFSGRVITSDDSYYYIVLNQLYIYDKNLNLINSFGNSGAKGYQSVSVDYNYIYLGDSDNTVEIYTKPIYGLKNVSLSPDLTVFGGTDGGNYSDKTYKFESGSFIEGAYTTKPDARSNGTLVPFNNNLILLGGNNAAELSDVWRLNYAGHIDSPSNEEDSPTPGYGFGRYTRRHGEIIRHYDNVIDITTPDTSYPHEETLVIDDNQRALVSLNTDYLKENSVIDKATLRLNLEDGDMGSIGGDLVPTMTSNTEPEGEVSASSIYNTSFEPYLAFDDLNNGDAWATGNYVRVGWLSYEFTTPKIINKYTLTPRSDTSTAPKNWTFEGWDGTEWVVLDQRTEITTWESNTKKEFNFNNNAKYIRYRINITTNNGGQHVGISEMELLNTNQTVDLRLSPATSKWYPTVTWNTKPGVDSNTIITQSVDPTTTGYVELDITDIVKKWVDGTLSNNGIEIRKADESNGASFTFSSMEAISGKPEFEVQYLLEGIASDDTEVDYDFYTSPEGIIVRTKEVGTVLGGTSKVFELELINSNTLKTTETILDFKDLNPEDDVKLSETETPFTSVTMPYDLGEMQPGEKRTVYIKVSPGNTSVGDRTFYLNVAARVASN